jgi:exoribonuclease-2
MEIGNIVEFIDRQKILAAVILEVKDKRLRVLTENNREVNLSVNRLSHSCSRRLDLSLGREKTVAALKETARCREALVDRVDVEELWEVLNSEQQWIDVATMTEFCFPDGATADHESAVIRAFFKNRRFFKFYPDRFFPFTPEQVEKTLSQQMEAERRGRFVAQGAEWLKRMTAPKAAAPEKLSEEEKRIVSILRSVYLFEKESPHWAVGKEMLTKAGIGEADQIFNILVRVGVWKEDENIELIRLDIPQAFPEDVMAGADVLIERCKRAAPVEIVAEHPHRDLRHLHLVTIDGQATLDFDDALSLEREGDGFRLGIHIVDVGHYVTKGSPIDREALVRCSSIYMPDGKIPMLPAGLAEDLCSLKAGAERSAITTLVHLSPSLGIVSSEIFPSRINVSRQLTYYDVNTLADESPDIALMRDAAARFRQYRMDAGALQISLPEVHVWVGEDGEITVNRVNRESPGRMLVSELMIMANWLMATFLKQRQLPAVFRAQPEPKERLYTGDQGSLFQNTMQRRLLNRFVLGHKPERHSGLGLDAYVTATSPIRKYCDLVTQRQIRAAFDLESAYTTEEIDGVIQSLEQPMANVSRIQQRRLRYWILKYLEKRVGEKQEAIVLARRRRTFQVIIPAYMIECELPVTSGLDLKPEDLVQVVIQRVNARKDVLSVFVG